MERINFSPENLLLVNLDKIKFNSWNPKGVGSAEYDMVKRGIEEKGLGLPVIVRQVDNHYEVVDGEQRTRACQELGYEKIVIYNLGNISDKEAKELTLWYQHQVPFDDLKLSKLLASMQKDYDFISVPFPTEELDSMSKIGSFDWGDYSINQDVFESSQGNKTQVTDKLDLTFSLTQEDIDLILKKLNSIDQDISVALVKLCKDE